jgi:hypothetical protein
LISAWRPAAFAAGAHPGFEPLIDHIEYDERRDPVAIRAWESV